MAQEPEVHVARQPIFDANLNVFGYELLFRNNFLNAYNGTNGDQATIDVIANSFLSIGIEPLTAGKRAFINFTANLLKDNLPAILPKELVAVEILENIIPDELIIGTCKKLKQNGYLLVLDDFVFTPEYMPLIELADIIKVDFLATPREEKWQLIQRLQDYPAKFLAEKVETQEDYRDAIQMGYSYFQGYFFCKPIVISGKNLPEYKINYFHILQEINRHELEFAQIEAIIKKDISLSYKLLKFINSSIFGFRNRISSLRQALTLLGQNELTKWVSLLALKGIDVLLNRPLREVLDEISLDEEIKNTLLEKGHNEFSILYKIIQSYEKGDWDTYFCYAAEMEISDFDVLKAYREALLWTHDLIICDEYTIDR